MTVSSESFWGILQITCRNPSLCVEYYYNPVSMRRKKQVQEEKTMAKYVCDVCGYEYDGDIPFEQLPDDYVCPLCGVGKDQFSKQD